MNVSVTSVLGERLCNYFYYKGLMFLVMFVTTLSNKRSVSMKWKYVFDCKLL